MSSPRSRDRRPVRDRFRYNTLLTTADNLMLFKYTVKNAALRSGKAATFMPKPIYGDNGNGMHCHQSIWKGGKPLFAGDGYAGLSEMALHYIGGLLRHARAIAAFAAPTTNSYKRLVPGFEAPVNLAYSSRNRSAAVRIPMYSQSPNAKRLESVRPTLPATPTWLFRRCLWRAGWDSKPDRSWPSAGQRHLRPVARGVKGGAVDAGLAEESLRRSKV